MSSTAGEILMDELSDKAFAEGIFDREIEELVNPFWVLDTYREDELPESGLVNIKDLKGEVHGVLEFELTFGVEPDGWGGRDVVVDDIKVTRKL